MCVCLYYQRATVRQYRIYNDLLSSTIYKINLDNLISFSITIKFCNENIAHTYQLEKLDHKNSPQLYRMLVYIIYEEDLICLTISNFFDTNQNNYLIMSLMLIII